MRRLSICMTMALVAGCPGNMSYSKLKAKPGYTIQVNAPWQAVHECLYRGMHCYGWGSGNLVEQTLHPEQEHGVIWVTGSEDYLRDAYAFMLEVTRNGPEGAIVTVHPANAWYARKSRDWLLATITKEFGESALRN